MGIIDFGWLMFNYVQLQNGLREALRNGSMPSFAPPDANRDCRRIFNWVESAAPLSGVQDSNIPIYYDHGYSTGSADSVHVFASCPASPTSNDIISTTMNNADRINIDIGVNVHFLTPFFGTWVRNGLTFPYSGARTILPSGIRV